MNPGGRQSRNETNLTSFDAELTRFELGVLLRKESNSQVAIVEPLENEVGVAELWTPREPSATQVQYKSSFKLE
jgi:hypothetical protein